VLVAHFSNCVQ